MRQLLNFLVRLKAFSSPLSVEELKAKDVWLRKLIWDNKQLKDVLNSKVSGTVVCNTISAGEVHQNNPDFRDEGHISFYKVFNRGAVAEHFGSMLHHDEKQGRAQYGAVVYERWGHIEHEGFWQEASVYLNKKEGLAMWCFSLDEAAYCGNLVPFLAGNPVVLRYSANHLSQLNQAGGETKMLHPSVARWFVNQGLWTQTDISAQVNSRTCPLEGRGFMGLPQNSPCESNYVATMCESVLRDYGLSLEQKVRFTGQALLSLGIDYWNDTLSSKLTPFLEGIELGALKAVCGYSVLVQDHDEQCLYETLQKATQSCAEVFMPEKDNAELWQYPRVQKELAMLMNLNPPQDRVELYYLGAMVLQMKRCHAQEPDVVYLPSLD